jgi:ATP-dependent DNA helicase RecQ
LKTYGAGKDIDYFGWHHYLMQLVQQGFLEIAYDDHQKMKLTPLSKKVLYEKMQVKLTRPEKFAVREAPVKKKTKKERLRDDLFERLRILRKQLADKQGIPAYQVFSDQTLQQMSEYRPDTVTELMAIDGVGQAKLDRYGETFLKSIEDFKIQERDRGSTHLVTWQMLQQGKSPQEIAKERKLNSVTIYSHIAALYEKGKPISIEKYISKEELDKTIKAIKTVGEMNGMKPIFEHLGGKIPFEKIRLALAVYHKKSD